MVKRFVMYQCYALFIFLVKMIKTAFTATCQVLYHLIGHSRYGILEFEHKINLESWSINWLSHYIDRKFKGVITKHWTCPKYQVGLYMHVQVLNVMQIHWTHQLSSIDSFCISRLPMLPLNVHVYAPGKHTFQCIQLGLKITLVYVSFSSFAILR